MKSFMAYSFHQVLLVDKISKDEIGRTCGSYGENRTAYEVLTL